jgi:hypothetical protein
MSLERVNLAEVDKNQVIDVTTGEDPETYRHILFIDEIGETPKCTMDEVLPDGTIRPGIKVELVGSGDWLPDPARPEQKIYSFQPGRLVVGGFMRLKFYHGELRGQCDYQMPISNIEKY